MKHQCVLVFILMLFFQTLCLADEYGYKGPIPEPTETEAGYGLKTYIHFKIPADACTNYQKSEKCTGAKNRNDKLHGRKTNKGNGMVCDRQYPWRYPEVPKTSNPDDRLYRLYNAWGSDVYVQCKPGSNASQATEQQNKQVPSEPVTTSKSTPTEPATPSTTTTGILDCSRGTLFEKAQCIAKNVVANTPK